MGVTTLPDYEIHQNRKKRCSSKFALLVSTVILALISLCLITLIIIHVFFHPLYKEKDDLCRTKDCTVTASMLIQSMDPTVDPCSDFYQFACGGFIRRNHLPDDGNTADVFEQHKREIIQQLNDVIKEVDYENQPKVIEKAQRAYFVCMNGSHNEEGEFRAFKNFIKRTLGGWPIGMGSSWKPKEPTLEEFLGKVMRLGYSIQLINIKIGADMLEPSMKRIMIEQPSVDLMASKTFRRRKRSTDSYNNLERNLKARMNLINSIANLLGNSNSTVIEEDLKKMVRLELTLEQLSANGHEPKNYSELYNKMPLNEVNNLTKKKLDWPKVLNAMFQKQPPFTGNDEVIVTSLDYMKKLTDIVGNFSRRTITNTIIWKIIYNLAEHAGPKIDKLFYQYQKQLHGTSIESPRWNLCLSWVNDAFAFAMTRIFVQQYIDRSAIKTAEEFVKLIQKAYKKNIEKSDWLDNETKSRALIKLRHFGLKVVDLMNRFIGYPEFIFDDEKLELYFSYITNISEVHFSNVVSITAETIQQFLETYVKPVDRETWTENPTDVNAFYEAQTNSIWFPAGVLNKPFFDDKTLAAVNFGIIGSLIGHEIGHGFDNEGSQFDETGRLRQWWSAKSMQEFRERTKCYVDQYNDYCPEELMENSDSSETVVCVNGSNTLAENIADNTGIQCAYDAYKMWIKENGEEKRLPGLEEYSSNQIFFLSFAYMWCENVPAEYWLYIYEDDTHSSGKYRVIGSLANMKEFSSVFKCSEGNMNRGDKRCTLW